MTGILLRRETFGPGDTQGRPLWGDTGRDVSNAATDQEHLWLHPGLEVETADPPLEALEEVWPHRVVLLASRTLKQ